MSNGESDNTKHLNAKHLLKRAIQEMQGIATAIIYDGIVDDSEIDLLVRWMGEHREQCIHWPLSDIVQTFETIIADGEICLNDRRLLLECLTRYSTGPD